MTATSTIRLVASAPIAHRVPNSRDEAAEYLVYWLHGISASFRNHIAQVRADADLCDECAAGEVFLRMREGDALKLSDQLDSIARVLAALHEKAEGRP